MHRSFNITLPSDSVYRDIYTLIKATTGAIPTDGILPDRVCDLTIITNPDGAGIHMSDSNSANDTGFAMQAGQNFERNSNRNTICLRDYTVTGSGEAITIDIEAK